MFQFTGLPLSRICSSYTGFPIRTSWLLRLCATSPSFSQLITSFFGFYYLGILRMPFFSFSLTLFSCNLFYLLFISHCPKSLFGGDKQDRTADLRSASAALSQLSYIPIFKSCMVGMNGLEPSTPALSAQCSNHLSYTPILMKVSKQVLLVFFSLERR